MSASATSLDANAVTSSRAPSDRRSALAALMAEDSPYFYRRALFLTKSPDRARDLVQDTVERALRDRASVVPAEKLRGWVLVIMRNLFIDRQRQEKRQRRWLRDDVCLDHLPAPVAEAAPRWQSLSVDDVRAEVAGLDERFRSVYELHVFAGLPYEQIASRLGVRPATVGTRLHRARNLLRAALVDQACAA